jgi:hypothetical protein
MGSGLIKNCGPPQILELAQTAGYMDRSLDKYFAAKEADVWFLTTVGFWGISKWDR